MNLSEDKLFERIDAKRDDLRYGEAEDGGGVNATEGKDGYEPVVVEQPRNEQFYDLPIRTHVAPGRLELSVCFAKRAGTLRRGGALVLFDEQEHRNAKDCKPAGHEQANRPYVLGALGVESEDWIV